MERRVWPRRAQPQARADPAGYFADILRGRAEGDGLVELGRAGLSGELCGMLPGVAEGFSAGHGEDGVRGVLVQAALNGGTTRAEHAGVPLTPAELAAEARAAADGGARALHLHPRDASGGQTLEPEHVLAAVAATRAASGLPIGVTTGIWTVGGETARRLDLVAQWTGPDCPDYASINMNEPGTEALADLLSSLGIEIEAGVWTAADARLLGAAGFRDRILRVLMEPTDLDPVVAVQTAAEAASELARLGITARQVHHGYALATWDVMRAAIAVGQDIRVGLEDTTVLPTGDVAAGNGDLVTAAVRLVRES